MNFVPHAPHARPMIPLSECQLGVLMHAPRVHAGVVTRLVRLPTKELTEGEEELLEEVNEKLEEGKAAALKNRDVAIKQVSHVKVTDLTAAVEREVKLMFGRSIRVACASYHAAETCFGQVRSWTGGLVGELAGRAGDSRARRWAGMG